MRIPILLAALLVCVLASPVQSATIRLGFYGWDGAPVECFDETEQDTLFCYFPNLKGPPIGPSTYHFGFLSLGLETVGCYLGDIESECPHRVTAWFEPDSVIIGTVAGGSDQNAQVDGDEWLGHEPRDFNAIRVLLELDYPCNESRELFLPLLWMEDVPAGIGENGPSLVPASWGEVRRRFVP